MPRKLLAVLAAATLAGTLSLWAPWFANADTTSRSAYEPVLDPADFSLVIDNAYFPLPVGRQWVYTGVKDGQTQRDVVTVTNRTKLVAEGITARVITDVATHNGALLEKTEDWYAQHKDGTVWYFGEETAAYLPDGTVDTSGSWEAGVRDAEPGIIMEAHPRVPDAYRQEFALRDQAQDTAWVVATRGSITVPAGTFHRVLTSLEATQVEPGVYDRKFYAPGVGVVLEEAITGDKEFAKLVSVSG
jgi:hypothetical protein